MTTLGWLFDKPLHVATWTRPPRLFPGHKDYRVTNPFDGVDLINGGLHMAVDVGDGQGKPAPLMAPISGQARGLFHLDGAKGIEFECGLRAWHLSQTLPVTQIPGQSAVGPWIDVIQGKQVGMTGNSGRQPMPFHTHIELWLDGVRVDPAPYLPMVEKPAIPLPEDDMKVQGADLRHIHNRQCRVAITANFREGPSGKADVIAVLDQGALLFPIASVTGDKVGSAPDASTWFYGIKTAGVEGNQLGCIHSSALPRTSDGKGVALEPIESGFTAEDMAASKVQGGADMKRAALAAVGKLQP